MKTNLSNFPDSRNFEPKDEEEGYFDEEAYLHAIVQWVTNFKKEAKEKLEDLGDTSISSMHDNVHAKLVLQGKKEVYEEVLGIHHHSSETPVQFISKDGAKQA
jgi:hypothetical protein